MAGRVAGMIGVLWVFWRHPVGDPKAVVLIALFHFVLFQAAAIPALILMQWPIVTSQYVDDDIRNSYLAQQLSRIFYSTIYLLFPLWLFKQDIHIAYPHFPVPADLTHFWILLSIPIFLFLAGGVLLFFLGVSRYRAQVKTMFDWLEQWLKQVLITNTLPVWRPPWPPVAGRTGRPRRRNHPPHLRKPAIAVLSRHHRGPEPGLGCVTRRR